MKALILAAGFGTRLHPYSKTTPKCLFPFAGRPLLDIIIQNLQKAGCTELIINTHHLSHKIEAFIAKQRYPIPVSTRYEPEILGTGGAIKNVADFWGDKPFMVINSDIVTDIPLKAVYDFHLQHSYPATLVLYDDTEFNTVWVNKDGFIIAFDSDQGAQAAETNRLAFTGIQVIDPEVLTLIPDNRPSSSIEMYTKLLSSGKKLPAFIATKYFWKDIGTVDRYRQTVLAQMTPHAFQQAFSGYRDRKIDRTPLSGDGSDRKWYRLSAGSHTLILVDHGLRNTDATCEVDAFVAIGRHLFNNGIPVPEIISYDTFSGFVFLEDLGDKNLQSIICSCDNQDAIITRYHTVIDILINLSLKAFTLFDRSWTYQTPEYNRLLILEKECRYFVEAFLNDYRYLKVCFANFKDEFSILAERAIKYSITGFMHRDLQSRNIMVKAGRYYLIDFQGGRIGPLQYDLASLLLDPYVNLPAYIQNQLAHYCFKKLSPQRRVDRNTFFQGYRYCALTRNLQILGAFGHLSRHKGKTYFEKYIPAAVKTLKANLALIPQEEFPHLTDLVYHL